ncbi:rRNA (cytosine-C(5))-methyltransferase NOP2C-like isoform X2 [Zingiber officinale]|nr:rRNA (cytosine-C(5))-methyltransferase NOP2C-like isoform X2 [Zingiber officinale]
MSSLQRNHSDKARHLRHSTEGFRCFSEICYQNLTGRSVGSKEMLPSLCDEQKTGALPLPDAFLHFLEANGLDPSIYTKAETVPRYIRVKPGFESQLLEIEDELNCKLEKITWLPDFFAIPPQIQIAGSEAYQEGKIYGMDAASGAAVSALNILPGDHVLDLCAAPGAKLCMLAELLGYSGSLTGVDIARQRLAACRTMLQKYSLGDRCRLFVADGTSFSLLPLKSYPETRQFGHDGNSIGMSSKNSPDIFAEWTGKRSWRERKKTIKAGNTAASNQIQSTPELIFYGRHSGVIGLRRTELFHTVEVPSTSGYDKVLVDAECTHDGSLKHIQKFENWGWETLEHRVLDVKRMDSLQHLQLQLLTNGFRLLRVGGTLVYSTCSLTVAQNEDVVKQFLLRNSSAELQHVEAATDWPCRSGGIPGTLRFDPKTSQTSGLFIAKFTRLAS